MKPDGKKFTQNKFQSSKRTIGLLTTTHFQSLPLKAPEYFRPRHLSYLIKYKWLKFGVQKSKNRNFPNPTK